MKRMTEVAAESESLVLACPPRPEGRWYTLLQPSCLRISVSDHATLRTLTLRMQSEAHTALFNEDILREVAQHFRTSRREDVNALGRMALVCRAFSDPALDVLWRNLESLLPLLNILAISVDLADHAGDVKPPMRQASLTCISDAQWNRFRSYARRVRSVQIHRYMETLHSPVIAQLATRSCGEPLLPSLVSLQFDLISAKSVSEILAFLSPLLHDVTLQVGSWGLDTSFVTDIGRDFVFALRCAASSLRHLTLERFDDPDFMTHTDFTPFSELQTLDIGRCVASFSVLSACAKMSSLITLDIGLKGLTVEDIKRCHGFPVLENLSVHSHPSQATALLPMLSTTVLRSFTYIDQAYHDRFLRARQDLGNYRVMLAALHSKSAATIRGVYFTIAVFDDVSTPSLMSVIDPLLDFRVLEELRIDSSLAVSVTSDDVCRMAFSWPNIQTLDFSVYQGSVSPSVYSLTEFAQWCPYLIFLKLPGLDPRPALPPESEWVSTSSCSLKGLCVTGRNNVSLDAHYEHGHSIAVARFLNHLFPNMTMEHCVGKEWTDINAVLEILQDAARRGYSGKQSS
ncbi:hypothetical protein BKA93DRAFT_557843 [Sparassis latifolia]